MKTDVDSRWGMLGDLRGKILGVLFLAVVIVLPAGVRADDEELEDLRDEMAREMAAFLEEAGAEQEAFLDERDRDFAEFLEEQWKEFETFAGLLADRTPKPAKLPTVAKPKDAVEPAGRIVAPPQEKIPPRIRPTPETAPPAVVKPGSGPRPAEPPAPVPAAIPPAPEPLPKPPASSLPSGPIASPELMPASPSRVEPEREKTPAAKPAQVPAPVVPEPTPVRLPEGSTVEFDFYGSSVRVPCVPTLKVQLAGSPGNQSIADYWKEVSSADFPPTIDRLLQLRDQLNLNDWGYYQLALQAAEAMQGQGNDATLFCWFVLCKSGYKAKVGYSDKILYLLVPTAQLLYGVPYYNLDGVRYYNFSTIMGTEKPGRLYTYQENYPGAEQTMHLLLEKTPTIRKAVASRRLKFSYAGQTYEVPVIYNPNAIRFLASYPQTDLPVFFTAAIETETEQSLLTALAPIVAGKTETEAVNILLRFVQTALEYRTDEEQFGREKYLFAEETLFFPYSDCEDRSILFSYLVRRLTGMEVVGLHYPGHIATAVRFSEKIAGDQVEVSGRIFTICDPTYINAEIGMAMPQFRTIKPEVIPIGI